METQPLPKPPASPRHPTAPIAIPTVNVKSTVPTVGSDGTPSKTRQLLNSIKNKRELHLNRFDISNNMSSALQLIRTDRWTCK